MKNVIPFLDLKTQYLKIREEIEDAVSRVFAESAFVGGSGNPFVKSFEEEFANYVEADHCIGVANGTDALEIALEALDLPSGSEILVPGNSFIASAEAVTRTGNKVVFVNWRDDDYTIDLEDAARRITPKTRAVIVVHLYGHPANMDAVIALAKENSLKVVEDCAQAHGAEYKGRRVGALGNMGAFSFYPGKNLGAYGDAGAVVTGDESLARRCRMIANHGRLVKYDHEFEGRNSRLDGLQAAVLSVKLKHLQEWTTHRRWVAEIYNDSLKNSGLVLPFVQLWAKPVWHLYVVRANLRDDLRSFLNEQGIQTGIHYPKALPHLQAYSYLGQQNEPTFANRTCNKLLSLPMGDHLTESQIEFVVNALNKWRQQANTQGQSV
jgi:dTDP-4-amino-4,6-dideoxygalactose transaminase